VTGRPVAAETVIGRRLYAEQVPPEAPLVVLSCGSGPAGFAGLRAGADRLARTTGRSVFVYSSPLAVVPSPPHPAVLHLLEDTTGAAGRWYRAEPGGDFAEIRTGPVRETGVTPAYPPAEFRNGGGLEVEFAGVVVLDLPGLSVATGSVLERPSQTVGMVLAGNEDGSIRLTLDTKKYYRGPDGRYFWNADTPGAPAGGQTSDYGVLELVTGVAGISADEDDRQIAAARTTEVAGTLMNFLRARFPTPGGTATVTLRQLLDELHSQGSLTEVRALANADHVRMGPPAIGDLPDPHVHHTVGVPLAAMQMLLEHVAARTWRNASVDPRFHTQELLREAVQLAAAERDRFVQTPGAGDRDLVRLHGEQLAGYLALLLSNYGGRVFAYHTGGLKKAHVAVLSRHPMHVVFESLPATVRQYLFERRTTLVGEWHRRLESLRPQVSAEVFRTADNRTALGRYIASAIYPRTQTPPRITQTETFGGMTELGRLDTTGRRPKVIVEIRSYDRRRVDEAALKVQHEQLYAHVHRAIGAAEDLHAATEPPVPPAGPQFMARDIVAGDQRIGTAYFGDLDWNARATAYRHLPGIGHAVEWLKVRRRLTARNIQVPWIGQSPYFIAAHPDLGVSDLGARIRAAGVPADAPLVVLTCGPGTGEAGVRRRADQLVRATGRRVYVYSNGLAVVPNGSDSAVLHLLEDDAGQPGTWWLARPGGYFEPQTRRVRGAASAAYPSPLYRNALPRVPMGRERKKRGADDD